MEMTMTEKNQDARFEDADRVADRLDPEFAALLSGAKLMPNYGETKTGRFARSQPEIAQLNPRPEAPFVHVPDHLAHLDFSEIEERVMSQLAEDEDELGRLMAAVEPGRKKTFSEKLDDMKRMRDARERIRQAQNTLARLWTVSVVFAMTHDLQTAFIMVGRGIDPHQSDRFSENYPERMAVMELEVVGDTKQDALAEVMRKLNVKRMTISVADWKEPEIVKTGRGN